MVGVDLMAELLLWVLLGMLVVMAAIVRLVRRRAAAPARPRPTHTTTTTTELQRRSNTSNSDSNPNSSFPPIFAAPPMMFSASAASSSSIRCPWLLLLLLALMAALLQSANAQAPLDQQIAAAEKRSPPAVRNPYSWMAAADVETDKRSALRRPQNPYSWMAANEEPGTGQWTLSRLRPFQALMAKRLTGSSGGSRTGPSRNPYSWTNF